MPPSPRRSGRIAGTARTIAWRCGAIACWSASSSRRAVQISRMSDLGQVLRRPRRGVAVGIDERVGERRHLGEGLGVAGVRQDDPGPHQPGDRPEPRQARVGQRPGPGEVALVGGERPPEAACGDAVEPVDEHGGMDGPALRPARGDLGLPAGAAAGAVAADPVEHPGLRQRPGVAVADGREVVEPQAGLPLGLEPRGGEGGRPDRAAADLDVVAERLPAPGEQRLPARGLAEQDGLGQAAGHLRRPAEPGAVRPQAVAPGARSPGEPFADGLERQSGLRHLPGTAPKIRFARTLAPDAARCHADECG